MPVCGHFGALDAGLLQDLVETEAWIDERVPVHEFQAIDRRLTDRQMRELRTISSRATISRTRFSNYYTYDDLKANPRDSLVHYFDASLSFAHWFYVELAFRFPRPPSICGDCGATQPGNRWMCMQRVGM